MMSFCRPTENRVWGTCASCRAVVVQAVLLAARRSGRFTPGRKIYCDSFDFKSDQIVVGFFSV
jgi:hypothetical protein